MLEWTQEGFLSQFMSQSDTLAWSMEQDPLLRSTIVAVSLYEGTPDWEVVKRKVDITSRKIPGLRQHVVNPPLGLGNPRWVYDPHFDLSYHLRRIGAPSPGRIEDVLIMARTMGMQSFDKDRPLWEFTVVEGIEGGRSAFICKIHHSMTDGIGGLQLALGIMDMSREAAAPTQADVPPAPEGQQISEASLLAGGVAKELLNVFGFAGGLPKQAVSAVKDTVTNPVKATKDTVNKVMSIVKLVRPIDSRLSTVMVGREPQWRFHIMDVPLGGLKSASKANGSTLNDAFVAAILGGLRKYHTRHGVKVDDLRMTLPVSLRKPGDTGSGNRITLLRMELPAGETDPRVRMHEVGARIKAWRAEPSLNYTQEVAGVINKLPVELLTPMLKYVDFLASNVPGFPFPVYLGGAKLTGVYPCVSPTGTGVNVTLMSYCDKCCIGVNMDHGAIPDAAEFLADLKAGFEEVMAVGGPHEPVVMYEPGSPIPEQRPGKAEGAAARAEAPA